MPKDWNKLCTNCGMSYTAHVGTRCFVPDIYGLKNYTGTHWNTVPEPEEEKNVGTNGLAKAI